MPDLLLEIRSEEIPARMQRKAAGDLKKLVTDALVEAGLTYEGAREYWTPRRLTLDVRGLTARSADVREERKGPRADATAPAVHGFLKGIGIPPQGFSAFDVMSNIGEAVTFGSLKVEIREERKSPIFVATIERSGRPAEEIIAEVVPGIIRNFPWPKSMRWGAPSAKPGSLKWVRPLQSIVCVFGTEHEETQTIPFEIDGIVAGNITYGHRFHAPGPITVRRFDDYVASLERAKVMLDADRRKDVILHDARDIAFANGLELVEDEGLLEEVSGLVEWPQVLVGSFDEEDLEIPSEIIRLTIKTNQKCFVTRPQIGEGLSNRFILISNIEAKDGGKEIVHGNGKVVRARLSDARHFWTRDQNDLPDLETLMESADSFGLDLTKPLDQRMAKLDALNVTFHAKIGTEGSRMHDVRALAEHLALYVGADEAAVERAVVLAKADLRTEVVSEFPELQGMMGRRYAEMQGEEPDVSMAIEDHYRPKGPTDRIPGNRVGLTVALADKLNTLIAFWKINEKPTGSKDPFALRRAALGVVRILVEGEITLPLSMFVRDADLMEFLRDRLKVYLKDRSIRFDVVEAVLAQSDADDFLGVARRAEALTAFISSEDGRNLLAGTKRASQMLAAEEKKGAVISTTVSPSLFVVEAEQVLYSANTAALSIASMALANDDYRSAMEGLSKLREPIDRFFVEVLVNDENEAIRSNRLALLKSIKESTSSIADFSKIAD